MKKLLGILVLGLLLGGNAYGKVGKGNFQMNEDVLEYFIEYLRHEYATSFVVSKDGNFSTYGICGAKVCSRGSGGTSTLLKSCKRETGSKCYIFAQRKNKKKIIRWNKVDYIFPSEEWNYNVMVKVEHLKSDNDGIKKNISDEQIKAILANLGFINQTSSLAAIDINISKTEETNSKIKRENFFCIWTGTGEYTDKKWFSHSSDHNNYKKYYGGAKDCRERALYVVTQGQNKKLYKKLLWKFKNRNSIHPAKKLNKKLFALVAEQTPKNIIELKEEVKETIEPNKTSTAKKVEKKTTTTKKKVEKKTTTTKKKVEKKTTTGGFVLGAPDSPAWIITASPERKRAYRQKRVSMWQAMSVAAICIQWDEYWEYPKDRLDMSTALENKGENPLVCRSPGQDQISRAKKETAEAKAAAAAAQAEVNKNKTSKNKSCRYITYTNMNGAKARKKVCN